MMMMMMILKMLTPHGEMDRHLTGIISHLRRND